MQRRDDRVVIVGQLGDPFGAWQVGGRRVGEDPRGLGPHPGFASLGARTGGGRTGWPSPGLVPTVPGTTTVPGTSGCHDERGGAISQVEGELCLSDHVTDGGRAAGMGLDEGGEQAQVRAQQLLLGAGKDLGADLHERVHLLHRELPDEAEEGLVGQGDRLRRQGPEQGDEVGGRRELFLARRFERLPGQ